MTPGPEPTRSTLRAHALRCTPQRELIYAALAAGRTHPTAEELLVIVRESDPGISLATVYNALDAFTQAGLARRLPPAGGVGPCRFDADMHEHLHVSLADGRVVDLPPALAGALRDATGPDFRAALAAHLGLPVADVAIQIVVR